MHFSSSTFFKARAMAAATMCAAALGCFSSVPETRCGADGSCPTGLLCQAGVCVANDGGLGDGGQAGGSAVGGGTAMGGGAGGGIANGGGGAPPTCGCTVGGQCVPGDSPLACGTDGGQCGLCGQGQQCVFGNCITAACGPGTCSGCCVAGLCVTPSMQTRFGCGLSGSACAACATGQTCRNGSCVTPTCDPQSCPTGCCDNGVCRMGDTPFNCGGGGAMCQQCAVGETCQAKRCAPLSAPDAGSIGSPDGGPVGAACQTSQGCRQGTYCLPEGSVLGPTGFPAGYCTAPCDSAMSPCPVGSVCVAPLQGFASTQCMASCIPGPVTSCRAGYVCAASDAGMPAYCRPSCINGGLVGCAPGSTCSGSTGTCQ